MKIAFKEKDLKEFKKLVSTMDDNEGGALFYNILIKGEEKVDESLLPYPIKKLDPKEYKENPYFINVRPLAKKDGSFKLSYLKKPSHVGFVYDEMVVKGRYYEETTPFGYFEKPFEFLALLEKERIWMSVTPHEINTMKEPIKKAKGRVVTLGLGLGYFAYMVHLKDEVSHVTIIEKDPRVIKLFKENILPFFPHKEKIEIIEGDATKYMNDAIPFDYLFADLWHFAIDGLPFYLKLNKFEKKYPSSIFDYWIEPSILILIRKALIILAEEELHHTSDDDYKDAMTVSDELVNALHFLLKEKEINSIDDLLEIMKEENLKSLAKTLYL
ncbi:MAG: hypothetical protein J6V79_03670 [Bacilli bacterium]|nr:hypothetical protein [Bacilli bacterium]